MARSGKAKPVPLLFALFGVAAIVSALASAFDVVRRVVQPATPLVAITVLMPPEAEPPAPRATKRPAAAAPMEVVRSLDVVGPPMARPDVLPRRDRQSYKREELAIAGTAITVPSQPPPPCGTATAAAPSSLQLSGFPADDATTASLEDLPLQSLCEQVEVDRLIRVRIDRAGTLIESRIEKRSGREHVNAEPVALVRLASHFRPFRQHRPTRSRSS